MLSPSDVSRPVEPAALPRVIEAEDRCAALDGGALLASVAAHLERDGALLFRGFPVRTMEDFQRFVALVTPDLLEYEFGSTPRSRLAGHVYTSTEYPAHQFIPQHNEQSYTTEWPLKLWFYCAQPASEGGSTPLCDSRTVYARLSSSLRRRFQERGVMYVRNYGNGLDVPWQKVFGTSDRAAVERYCARVGIVGEWSEDGELRTRQRCQAVARHPSTGELVWFNQAHLFHVSNLEPAAREGLLAILSEDELPRHAFYGDGTPIEASALDEIRGVYAEVTRSFPWRAGDVLLIDNMLVAHGRAPFRGERKVLVAMAEPYRAPASEALDAR